MKIIETYIGYDTGIFGKGLIKIHKTENGNYYYYEQNGGQYNSARFDRLTKDKALELIKNAEEA